MQFQYAKQTDPVNDIIECFDGQAAITHARAEIELAAPDKFALLLKRKVGPKAGYVYLRDLEAMLNS